MISKSKLHLVFALALTLMIPVSLSTPQKAHAQGRRGFDDRRREEDEARRREEERRRWEMEHPVRHEVYVPAPVVYAPPPPSPGISIVLPINFR